MPTLNWMDKDVLIKRYQLREGNRDILNENYCQLLLEAPNVENNAKEHAFARGQRQLETLRQAVGKTLEKKRRLGQYAVTWQDGKPVVQGDDAPARTTTLIERLSL